MAKTSKIQKDIRQRIRVKLDKEKRASLKEQILKAEVGSDAQRTLIFKLSAMSKDGSAVRLHNRCQYTGRPRGVQRIFQASRMCIREIIGFARAPGWVKASW